MKVLAIMILIAVLAAVVALVFYVRTASKASPSSEVASPKALRSASDAVRVLDQILTDPTLIGSSKWREEATKAVDDWYKG